MTHERPPTSIDWERVPVGDNDASECALVSRFPVTVAQFGQFMSAGGYRTRSLWSDAGWTWLQGNGFAAPAYWNVRGYKDPSFPVTGISFWEAQACARFHDACLPTHAEWHAIASNFAATRYPWGDEEPVPGGPRANLAFFGQLKPAGLTRVDASTASGTRLGVRDMIGNVSEWCTRSEDGRDSHGYAILAGGSSWHTPVVADNLFRDEVWASTRDNQTGLRLIRRPVGDAAADTWRALVSASFARSGSRHADPAFAAMSLARPTRPFRQEGLPHGLTEQSWKLSVGGLLPNPRSFTLEELRRALPKTVDRGMLVCVCRWGAVNEVAGVLLHDVLRACGFAGSGKGAWVQQTSVGGPSGRRYEACVALDDALRHRALLCYEIDGAPLSMETGWPLRYLDFEYYGYKLVKCLASIAVTDGFKPGWWEQDKQYDPVGTVQPGRVTLVGSPARRVEINSPGRQPMPRTADR